MVFKFLSLGQINSTAHYSPAEVMAIKTMKATSAVTIIRIFVIVDQETFESCGVSSETESD